MGGIFIQLNRFFRGFAGARSHQHGRVQYFIAYNKRRVRRHDGKDDVPESSLLVDYAALKQPKTV